MIRIVIGAALAAAAPPALAQSMPGMDHMQHQPTAAPEMDHATMGHDMAAMSGMSGAAYGEASGTSRVPAGDRMQGLHLMAGDWMLMAHGYAWSAVTHQGGPRGGDMAYVQSMAMIEGNRPLGEGARLRLRAMMSAEPLMGERGYPNLFATGESAHGQPLVDRQHPHDLLMELSGRVDVDAGAGSLFVYGGLPGEPALGPSAFMHRGSDRFLPEGPITHHWLDSTHISFGVITAGYAAPKWQLEGSVFNGREPGEDRYNIETGPLSSWSLRASLTPDPHWAAQLSYGWLKEPERLHAGEDEGRLTASVSYSGGGVDATMAFSRKDRMPGRVLTAWLAEATWMFAPRHAVFGRVENVADDELFEVDSASPLHDRTFRVTRLSAGYAYSVPLGGMLSLAFGASGSVYAKPRALDAAYGRAPKSATAFAKLMLGR